MRKFAWGLMLALALAACLAGCGSAGHARSHTTAKLGQSIANLANLWVTPSGGTCVRRSTPSPAVAGQACGSLEAAYQAATCGDVVNIAAGNYGGSQDLADRTPLDGCSRPVELRATPGTPRSAVVFDGISSGAGTEANTDGASNWVLSGVTVKSNINLYPPSRNVTIDEVQGGTLTIVATSDVTIEKSNWGPCYNVISAASGKSGSGPGAPTFSPNPAITCNSNFKIDGTWTQQNGTVYHLNGLTIRNNVIHDFIDDNSNPYYGHFECMFVDGGANITIDSNRFYDCQIYSIFLQPFSGYPITGLTIQNNWFWATQGVEGSCSADRRCPPSGPRISALDFGEETPSDVTHVLVRYNSFGPENGIAVDGIAPDSSSDVRFVGNIVGNSGYGYCIPGAAYSYNIWLTQYATHPGTCGPTDVEDSSSPFVAPANSGSALADLTPRCGTLARDFVKPNTADYRLDYDIDGRPRNPAGPRDAGAVEPRC